jgi:hypothetical protein
MSVLRPRQRKSVLHNMLCKSVSSGVFELYNPFYSNSDEVTLRYVIPGDGDVVVELIASSGSRIQSAEIKNEQAGLHTYKFDLQGLASGSYIASVHWRDKWESVQFFVK